MVNSLNTNVLSVDAADESRLLLPQPVAKIIGAEIATMQTAIRFCMGAPIGRPPT
jgi:hypothetical protein